MCNDDSKLKKENIGNGTLCRVQKIKFNNGTPPLYWKSWDGRKMYTVSVRYVEWVEFERFPDNEKILSLKSAIVRLENELVDNDDSKKVIELEQVQKEFKIIKAAWFFKLFPVKLTAEVNVSLANAVTKRTMLKGVSMLQLSINMNDATKDHKLHGIPKDKLIVVLWLFTTN